MLEKENDRVTLSVVKMALTFFPITTLIHTIQCDIQFLGDFFDQANNIVQYRDIVTAGRHIEVYYDEILLETSRQRAQFDLNRPRQLALVHLRISIVRE